MENLIQLIGYRDYVDKNGAKQIKQKHFEGIRVTGIDVLFKKLDLIIELIPEEERYNVHYTCFMAKPRDEKVKLRTFHSQNMIPIDLDGIDLTYKDEYIKIVLDIMKVDSAKTGVFCSGNGLHIVVLQEETFDHAKMKLLQPLYKRLCSDINEALYNNGLQGNADPIRLNQSATLRLPKTINKKDGKPDTLSYVIQGNVEPQDFSLDKLYAVEAEAKVEAQAKEYTVDTLGVLAGCDFLKWCKENPNKVSEPQWQKMISALASIPQIGESLCHTYSEGATCYTASGTKTKYDQAKVFGKPPLCKGIDAVWNNCSSCPYYNKVTTPLQIKSETFIATQKDGFHFLIHKKDGTTSYKPDYDGLANYFTQLHPAITNVDTRMLMKYNGKHWEVVDDLAITSFAATHFAPTATNTMRAEFLGNLKNKEVSSRNFIGKNNNDYINFQNGTLNLATRELAPHNKEAGFTYVLPYNYDKSATCPNFDKLMDNLTLKDKALADVILEYVGYAISGRPNSWIQKVMVLSGEGSNGKSTFMNIIRKLVGEECYSSISIASMAKESNRYTMYGKLFNISFDEDPKALLKGGVNIFKAITAGDPVDIRALYAMPVSAAINAKLIVACNKPLETNDHTHAVYRRMLIIPFRARFEGATDNKEITKDIYTEMSGIYNRVLDGLDRLIANNGNFTKSDTVNRALNEYKYESAVFQRFFEDRLQKTNDLAHFIAIDDVMDSFKNWSTLNNERLEISSIKLMKELKSLNLIPNESCTKRIGTATKRGYIGICKNNEIF